MTTETPPTSTAELSSSAPRPSGAGGPHPRLVWVLCLAVSLGAVLLTWGWQRANELVEYGLRFDALTTQFQRDLQSNLNAHLGLLRDAAGWAGSVESPTAARWRRYILTANLPRYFPGVKAMAYAPTVPRDQLSEFWKRFKEDQGAKSAVSPGLTLDHYHPLAMVEPGTWDNLRTLGLDLAATPERHAALNLAEERGDAVLSEQASDAAEFDGPKTMVLFHPVYRAPDAESASARPRKAVAGFVMVSMLAEELISPLHSRYQAELGGRLLEVGSESRNLLLFAKRLDTHEQPGRFSRTAEFNFGGRLLRLELHSEPEFDQAIDRSRSNLVLLTGGALALLLSWMVASLSSARRRAEALAWKMTEGLRASEERFQLVVRGTVGGVWDRDMSTEQIYMSERVEELLGYPSGTLERSFAGLSRLVHPDDHASIYTAAVAHLKYRTPLEADCRVRRADGNWGWFRLRGQAVWGADGRATRIAGSFADIGRERAAAEEVERYQAFLNRLIDHLPDPFTVKNRDLTILMANQAYSEFLGLPREQIVGRRTTDFLPRPRSEEIEAVDREAFSAGCVRTAAMDMRDGQGHTRHGLLKKVPCDGVDGDTVLIGMFIDVTQAREAGERFEAIVDNAPMVAIRGFTADGSIRHWNRASASLYGYTREQAMGRRVQDLVYGSLGSVAFQEEVAGALRGGACLAPVEVERQLADGRRVWVYSSLFPIYKDGQVAELLCMEVDVTARKRSELQLRESEARWQFALEGAGDGVWDWNLETQAVQFSQRWKAMLGYLPDEIPDALEEWQKRIHPNDLGRVLDDVARHLRGDTESYESEHRMLRKDGSYMWILVRGKVVARDADGRALRFIGTHADMTLRKRAEEHLAESERRFRMLSDSAPVMIWMCDPQGQPTFVNKVWTDFTGLDEAVTVSAHRAELIHPDDAPLVRSHFNDALAAARTFELEYRLRRADGAFRWVRNSGVPRFDTDACFLGFVGSIFDVTERRAAEDALRQSRDQLQDLVLEQTADLRLAKDAAERANEAKSRFLANMSHELRTPMHAILSFAHLGSTRLASAKPEKLGEYFERIHVSGQRLLGLLNDLLDLSRLEAGRTPLELRSCDLAAVVEDVRREFEPLLAGKSLICHVVAQADVTAVRGDPTQLGQIVRNLLSNAIKFSPHGRVIEVSLAPIRMAQNDGENAAPGDAGVEMVVSDQGIGIPESELESVFDKFVQSSKTRSGAGGTGLGLAICREIANAHGGRIFARGNGYGGADFVLRLPAHLGVRAQLPESELMQ